MSSTIPASPTGRLRSGALLLPRLGPFLLVAALLSGCGGGDDVGGRVFVLGLDGLDPQVVDLLMSEGRMPHFARLRQEGAYGRLRSQEPLLSPIIWTTIATGRQPTDHGIGHFTATDETTGQEIPASSAQRRVKALWNIASENDREVLSVGWWATWPPEEVDGAIVSDHVAYHFLFDEGLHGERPDSSTNSLNKTHPPELYERIEPMLRGPGDLSADELEPFVDLPAEELDRPFDFDDDLGHFRWALATAKSYRDIGLDLWREREPALGLLYIEGTDSSSHLFGHLFRRDDFVGELAEQQRVFGDTTEQMYLFADRLLGEVLETLGDDATLVVLSDHGFQLGALHDDPSRTRDMRRVSERFHRIEGILYLHGPRIRAGARIDQASILDVTPTVLGLLGLPAAADMPGRVLAEAFSDRFAEKLASSSAGTRIASWEDGAARGVGAGADAAVNQAQLEHLRSLGYLSGGSAGGGDAGAISGSQQGDRNLAAIAFQSGDYRQAARLYRDLLEANPEDAGLHTSLAGALGALGRYDDALTYLGRAVALDPLNIEAYHNRAVVHERRGDLEAAITDYRTALRYRSDYEPSRSALVRLTGSADFRPALTEAQTRAEELGQEASLLARRGDYPGAMELLDQAEALAPDFALVYQYRSNVAYLRGDLEGAIEALERGLELEPDNALFRTNLARLRGGSN